MHIDPITHFKSWFDEAHLSEPNDPNAMALATVNAEGQPSLRMVLLKGFDDRGFVFYTNTESRKGSDLAANQNVALLFHWKSLRRQIRVEGQVEPATEAEADAYFASRPRISRLGAWASDQSRSLASREVLLSRLAEAEARYPEDPIPRPPYWSGYRVRPSLFEFWHDMPYRLHDRLVLKRDGEDWVSNHLFP